MRWFWLSLGIFLGVGELLTREYLLLWVALGALVAGISALVLPFVYQMIIFLLISLCLTVLSRKKNLEENGTKTRDSLVGKEAIVVETVQRVYCDRGLIKIDGDIWRAYCDQDEILVGTIVTIVEVNGNKLKVEK